ncbi:MAG TPA: carbonic anhydrase [Terriglobales bacterium]
MAGESTVAAMGERILDRVIEIASGSAAVHAELLGQYDFIPWKRGVSLKMPSELLARNAAWAANVKDRHPEFFAHLAHVQTPRYLWIGCSDSRVPPTTIMDLKPGEVFVHRNIANVVDETDASCMAALQFGIEVLKIEHVIVAGHYGCGGVGAVCRRTPMSGALGAWLAGVEAVRQRHGAELGRLEPDEAAIRLTELNTLEQARRVAATAIVRGARARGQRVSVDAWLYEVATGHLRDLGFAAAAPAAAGA